MYKWPILQFYCKTIYVGEVRSSRLKIYNGSTAEQEKTDSNYDRWIYHEISLTNKTLNYNVYRSNDASNHYKNARIYQHTPAVYRKM